MLTRLSEARAARLLLAAALLFTGLAYLPSVGFGFADDDHRQIVENPRIRTWSEVPGYFTSDVWAHLTLDVGDRPPAYYRPLFLVWLFANYRLFGTDPAGWHLASVMLHVLATLLAYRFVRAITGEAVPAALAALLFGLHPVHVESVAWISGAPDPLMTAAFLASLLCYLKGRETEGFLWPACSVFLFGLALLAKETAIVLPAVLLAYERTLGVDREKKPLRWGRLAPYAVLALVYFLARRAFLGGTFMTAVPWSMMVLSWPSIIWNYYLRHLFWPVNLTAVCDMPYVTYLGWRNVILPAMAITVLVAVIWMAARRRPAIGFAMLWMGLLILPPLYLRAFVPGEIAHDRYLYLPSLGLCMLIAPALARLGVAGLATTAVLASLAALGVYRESQPWSNDIALFQRALVVAPGNLRAERQLALALPAAERCGDAIPILDRLRQQQEDPRILLALGACYYGQSRFEEAGPLIERALVLSPRYLSAYTILILTRLGENRTADAETIWRRAVRAAGTGETRGLHLLGGQILRTRGDLPGAAAEFRLELTSSPESEEAARLLEEVEWTLGKRRAAGQ